MSQTYEKPTMQELREMDADILTPYDISGVMGSDPATIRLSARQHPELIGYAFAFHGNQMKIPRKAFINWMDGIK
ncbi:MAG: hypothetical protein IJV64_09945 [Oscillospiraceae bacterium]|nr:hypothetical protein [Oscillospiraceae bacterium]